MSEWQECKLGDVVKFGNGKVRPKESGYIPVYGGNGILDYCTSSNYSGETIIIGRVGAYCGSVYYENQDIWISDNALSAKPKGKNNTKFLYYFLKNMRLNEFAEGSSHPLVTQTLLNSIDIKITTDPTEQKKIAEILTSLDAKIDLLNNQNATLESMAETLFRHHFIEFNGFSKERILHDELGEIPIDLNIERICNMKYLLETGKRPKGGVGAFSQGVPSIGAENIKGLGVYDYGKTKFVSCDFANTVKRGIVKGYELLIYKDGGTPGYFCPHFSIFGEGYPFDEMLINEHVFKLDFQDVYFNAFAYFYFSSDIVKPYLEVVGAKAAIPGINQGNIRDLYIPTYDNNIVKEFSKFAYTVINRILKNSRQIKTLASLRDTLLPKLMNNEIKI